MQPQKILKDEYTPAGEKMFNPTKPHGTVYADGFVESKFVQDGQHFRGDRTPIEGAKERPNDPPKVAVVESTKEEVVLAKRVDALDAKVDGMASGISAILEVLNRPKNKGGRPKKPSEPVA